MVLIGFACTIAAAAPFREPTLIPSAALMVVDLAYGVVVAGHPQAGSLTAAMTAALFLLGTAMPNADAGVAAARRRPGGLRYDSSAIRLIAASLRSHSDATWSIHRAVAPSASGRTA